MAKQRSLLADAKRGIVTWGGTLKRSYGDDQGDYAVGFSFRGNSFIGVSKEYAERNLASFEQTVARRARDQDVYLVEFFGAEPTLGDAYVFNPETVLEDGVESHGSSKKGTPTEWYEISLNQGVLLGDFVSGRAEPSEPSPEEEKDQPVGITDYA